MIIKRKPELKVSPAFSKAAESGGRASGRCVSSETVIQLIINEAISEGVCAKRGVPMV